MSGVNGWPKWRLEDCCDILDSRRMPVNAEERGKRIGDIPYYGANGQQGVIDDFIFDEPLILMAEDGGRFDEFATRPIAYRISGKSWVNNHALVLRAKRGFCQDAVFYTLEHKDIQPFIVGGTRAKLNQRALRSIEISLPKDKTEQTKIAEILSTVDRAIEQTEALIAKQQRIKTGLMEDLLTRGIDEQGNLRSEETHQFKDSPLGRIPVEWDVKTIQDVVSIVRGFAFASRDYIDYGILNFRVTNVGHPATSMGNSEYLPPAFFDLFRKQQLLGGEIVIVMVGATTGKLGRVPVESCPALMNQNMWNLAPKQSRNRDFLWYLLPETVSRHMQLSQGSARDFLKQSEFAKTVVAVPPAATNEQDQIAEFLIAIDKRIESLAAEKEKHCAIKTALMQDLLTGEKRVTPLLEATVTT